MTESLAMATGNRAHGLDERGHDLYETPRVAIECLRLLEPLPHRIWEPACGPGAIVTALREAGHEVVATDLIDYGLAGASGGIDFLLETAAPQHCEAIVTNPPFAVATAFVRHAIDLCPEVHMLLRLAFAEGLRWERGLGAHLARIHVFAPRLPMMHRDGWTGPRAGSAIPFAWFVFQRDHARRARAPAQIDWVNWRKLVPAPPGAADLPIVTQPDGPLLELMEAP